MADLDLFPDCQTSNATSWHPPIRTKTLFEQQTLEKHMLGVGRLVSNANLLIFGTKSGLNKVHRPQTIGRESDASTLESLENLSLGVQGVGAF